MAADWSLAAAIIAIVALAFTPGPQKLIGQLSAAIYTAVWPTSKLCETLEWSDLDEDRPLHLCNTSPLSCAHFQNLKFANFFTARRSSKKVKKPASLDLNTKYIRTDTTTLVAFLVLLDQQDVHIELDCHGKVWTAYVKIGPPNYRPEYIANVAQIKRNEFKRIIDGRPPWYRDPLPLAAGVDVPHPIRDLSDISRGGWVVAVGLSMIEPLRTDRVTTTNSARQDGEREMVMRAFKRIIHCIGNLQKAFQDHILEMAKAPMRTSIEFVRELYGPSNFRGSFERTMLTAEFGMNWLDDRKRRFAKNITKEQAILMMQVFNQLEEPNEDQIENLRGIVLIAVRAALIGTYLVGNEIYCRYSRCERDAFGGHHRRHVPMELGEHRHVYLYENTED